MICLGFYGLKVQVLHTQYLFFNYLHESLINGTTKLQLFVFFFISRCADATTCPEAENKAYLVSTRGKISNTLDNAPASYEGAVLKFTKPGIYSYMCTRNNSFSNRSQKGSIVVK